MEDKKFFLIQLIKTVSDRSQSFRSVKLFKQSKGVKFDGVWAAKRVCRALYKTLQEAVHSAYKKMTPYWPTIGQLKCIMTCHW